MKTLLFLLIVLLIFSGTILSQGTCSNIKIESPAVLKPTDGNIVSATCSALVVQWKGSNDQTYAVNATMKDNQTIQAIDPKLINATCDNGGNCTASIPVKAGATVSWSVTAISEIDGRAFYSYPLQGEQDYTVPDCVADRLAKPGIVNAGKTIAPIDKEITKVVLYPNPVHATLNINVTTAAGSKDNKAIIQIFDENGRAVLGKQANRGNIQINVSRLSNGTYFLNVQDSKGKVIHRAKFIKE